jgi:hypothetical protein
MFFPIEQDRFAEFVGWWWAGWVRTGGLNFLSEGRLAIFERVEVTPLAPAVVTARTAHAGNANQRDR